MKKYEKEKNNPGCFIRKDGANTFLEVLSPTPEFNKITINFIEYNKDTYKQIRLIPIYFTVPEFLVFCKKIEQGIIQRMCEAEKKRCLDNNIGFPNYIYQQLGGTPATSPSNTRTDGRDEAREFTILPATKSRFANVMLKAERGPGKKTTEGLISMDRSNRDIIEKVIVSLSYDALLEIALISQVRIQAYVTAREVNGDFKYYGANKGDNAETTQMPVTNQMPEQKTYNNNNNQSYYQPNVNYSNVAPQPQQPQQMQYQQPQPQPQSQQMQMNYQQPAQQMNNGYQWGETPIEIPTPNNNRITDRFVG